MPEINEDAKKAFTEVIKRFNIIDEDREKPLGQIVLHLNGAVSKIWKNVEVK